MPRYRRASDTSDDDGAADELGDRPRPTGHHDGVDHADGREADDGNRRRRQRVALPAPDLGDVVGPGSGVHPDQQHSDDLEHEDAGQVREQVAPAAERRPSRTSRPIATIDIVQPVAARSTARRMSVSQPVRTRAKAREMAASTRSVTRRAHAECTVTTIQAISTTEQASHSLPVVPIAPREWRRGTGRPPSPTPPAGGRWNVGDGPVALERCTDRRALARGHVSPSAPQPTGGDRRDVVRAGRAPHRSC